MMATRVECVCCQDIFEVVSKINEHDPTMACVVE